ncbi:BPSL0067 family protein [Massilia sp. MS-15]|uniref:BPSL0067 family protein n=1 Tax=Massilia sp. MS-15 TaxID=2878200 RepID=UPI001CD7279F|nr:BPSL0067 family protein [Massilia sp. MS-15]MCA1247722.1 BPSL0067 family protein [Massilia sp. MS-15]
MPIPKQWRVYAARVCECQGTGKERQAGEWDCVALVQSLTGVGHTSTWRPGERVMDAKNIPVGTVIATFEDGRYPNRSTGNHAALFLYFGPKSLKTGKPSYIAVMDQWRSKPKISARSIWPRGKSHAEGGWADDSDNAETFYVVR